MISSTRYEIIMSYGIAWSNPAFFKLQCKYSAIFIEEDSLQNSFQRGQISLFTFLRRLSWATSSMRIHDSAHV